jgi:hypothetical protein
MLGHRELFHSNLLAWFFEKLPEESDRVFKPFAHPAPKLSMSRKALREKNHMDLLFQWSDRHPLVIENKVFSLPNEKQLATYARRIPTNGAAVLLSLVNPHWPDNRKVAGGREWCWVSYEKLAQNIRSSLSHSDRSYATDTMRHYSDVIQLLSELATRTIVTDSNDRVSFSDNVKDAFAINPRLISAMGKLRAWSVAQCVSRALGAAGIGNIDVESAFTNGTPLNSWFCPISCAPGAKAGWQLQNNQFRLAIITPHLRGVSEEKVKERFDFAKHNERFFDFSDVDTHLRTVDVPTQPPKGFGRYNPDFVYRYKKVPDITVKQLEEAAVAVARGLVTS